MFYTPLSMFRSCVSVSVNPSVLPRLRVSVLSPVSIDGFLPNFVIGASCVKDELVRFWGQRSKI